MTTHRKIKDYSINISVEEYELDETQVKFLQKFVWEYVDYPKRFKRIYSQDIIFQINEMIRYEKFNNLQVFLLETIRLEYINRKIERKQRIMNKSKSSKPLGISTTEARKFLEKLRTNR